MELNRLFLFIAKRDDDWGLKRSHRVTSTMRHGNEALDQSNRHHPGRDAAHPDGEEAPTAILKADKAKGKTAGTDMAFVKQLETDVKTYGGARTTQRGTVTVAKTATQREVKARASLAAALKSIRDDVADALADDAEVQKAFGRGMNLDGKTTNSLLDAADAIAGAFEAHADVVKSAGVNQRRIDSLTRLRVALAAADSTQRGKITSRLDATMTKDVLLVSIKQRTARLRKRLGSAGAAQMKQTIAGKTARKVSRRLSKASLASTSRRRSVKKRATKKPPA